MKHPVADGGEDENYQTPPAASLPPPPILPHPPQPMSSLRRPSLKLARPSYTTVPLSNPFGMYTRRDPGKAGSDYRTGATGGVSDVPEAAQPSPISELASGAAGGDVAPHEDAGVGAAGLAGDVMNEGAAADTHDKREDIMPGTAIVGDETVHASGFGDQHDLQDNVGVMDNPWGEAGMYGVGAGGTDNEFFDEV